MAMQSGNVSASNIASLYCQARKAMDEILLFTVRQMRDEVARGMGTSDLDEAGRAEFPLTDKAASGHVHLKDVLDKVSKRLQDFDSLLSAHTAYRQELEKNLARSRWDNVRRKVFDRSLFSIVQPSVPSQMQRQISTTSVDSGIYSDVETGPEKLARGDASPVQAEILMSDIHASLGMSSSGSETSVPNTPEELLLPKTYLAETAVAPMRKLSRPAVKLDISQIVPAAMGISRVSSLKGVLDSEDSPIERAMPKIRARTPTSMYSAWGESHNPFLDGGFSMEVPLIATLEAVEEDTDTPELSRSTVNTPTEELLPPMPMLRALVPPLAPLRKIPSASHLELKNSAASDPMVSPRSRSSSDLEMDRRKSQSPPILQESQQRAASIPRLHSPQKKAAVLAAPRSSSVPRSVPENTHHHHHHRSPASASSLGSNASADSNISTTRTQSSGGTLPPKDLIKRLTLISKALPEPPAPLKSSLAKAHLKPLLRKTTLPSTPSPHKSRPSSRQGSSEEPSRPAASTSNPVPMSTKSTPVFGPKKPNAVAVPENKTVLISEPPPWAMNDNFDVSVILSMAPTSPLPPLPPSSPLPPIPTGPSTSVATRVSKQAVEKGPNRSLTTKRIAAPGTKAMEAEALMLRDKMLMSQRA